MINSILRTIRDLVFVVIAIFLWLWATTDPSSPYNSENIIRYWIVSIGAFTYIAGMFLLMGARLFMRKD